LCNVTDFFQPQLGENISDEHGADNVWFQQDGATAHTSRRSFHFSEKCFLDVLSPCVVISGSSHIARFDPLRLFLWGYLKAKVYEQRPQTLEALKEAIRQEVPAITPEMILKVMGKYRERLHQCINIQGRHLSDVLFKTR